MKFLVTGGAGFIGSHFVDFLLNDSEVSKLVSGVTVVDKFTYASNPSFIKGLARDSKLQIFDKDICDRRFLFEELDRFDYIVNFAAESHVDQSLINPEKFIYSNILGASNLFDLVLLERAKTLIQISTDEVYGNIGEGSASEGAMISPRSPYSSSKASADLIAISYGISFGVDIRLTRASNNFGPRQHSEKMIPTIIQRIASNKAIPIYGSGEQIRDWLYVSDHVEGIWKVIVSGTSGETYNLGGGNELTNLQLVNEIAKLMPSYEAKIEHVADRKGHDFRYSLDFTKATKVLNYLPKITLQEGLSRTIESYLSNRN